MSGVVKTWTEWLKNSRFSYMSETQKQQTLLWLSQVRDKVLDRANLKPDDVLIDIGTGNGLLAFGAFERLKKLNGSGRVIVSDAFRDCVEECLNFAKSLGLENEMDFIQADAFDIQLPENLVDVVVMRSVLVHILDKPKAINEFFKILKPFSGRISIFEPIINKNTKYYELINPDVFPNYQTLKEAEEKMVSDNTDPLMNFDEDSLKRDFEEAGFKNIDIEIVMQSSTYEVVKEMIDPWFNTPPSPGRPTVKEKYRQFLPENEVDEFIEKLKIELDGKTITINSPTAYIYAEKH
jgi:ubiquinone/menaquinone biosynthesis C-methylase UbiE